MTASQTGVEGAVERLTACLDRDQWCAGTTVTHQDLRTLLADHAALTARHAALEGERDGLARMLRQRDRLADNGRRFWVRAGEAALNGDMCELRNRIDMAKAEPVSVVLSETARQSREETGDRT